ncbi:hypothetical protein PMIN01_08670 [Paraphaeosphaeria minitans]|uniref:Uncharacterized protein n=1 Tax=Paraphaeosphaeria minitans TaxID=565426 RepID=A0A9P6GDA8_9PLEO|nr:hypothetical protein PMIN01_08670 [Paraphaeosphaeria minitans]
MPLLGLIVCLPSLFHRHGDDRSIRSRIETHRAAPLLLWETHFCPVASKAESIWNNVPGGTVGRYGILVTRLLLDSSPLASWFPDNHTWAECVSSTAGFFASSVGMRGC